MENMEKRVLLALALCMGVLLLWHRLFPTTPPPQATPVAVKPAPAAPGAAAPGVTPPGQGQTAPDQAQAAAPAGHAGAQPAARPAEELTTISWPSGKYRAVVTSYGAALKGFELLDKKYIRAEAFHLEGKPTDRPEPRRIVNQPTNLQTSNRPSLWLRSPELKLPEPEDQTWRLVENTQTGTSHKLVYLWESPEAQVRKTLEFFPDRYDVPVTVEVRNLKAARQGHHLEVGLEGYQNPSQTQGGFFSMFSQRAPQNEVAWDRAGKMQSAGLEALREKVDAEKLRGDLRWIGIGQQYFLLAVSMEYGGQAGGEKQARAEERVAGSGAMKIAAEYAGRDLDAGQAAVYHMTLYAGPKLPELLDDVKVNGQPSGLSTSLNYTLEVLARPLLWVLRQIHALVASWALAIVLLTVLVKLLTLYPTHRSMKSMKAISDLRPEIEALKEKYGEDKQRFNLEMMNLYRKHGVNPLGGCLPIVLQMPIWFALYSMLSNAVELYRVPFLWIQDLTAADPYLVLPLLTGALMYLQSKLSPAPPDPQQRAMTVMMPIMFTAFSLFLPAGLTLYIMTNTVLGMIQQVVINRGKSSVAVAPARK
jgi:YidC/Oxa1 family membrane protein insertase